MTYAEDVNYWKTSTRASDTWIDSAKKEIDTAGGVVLGDFFGADASGRAAYRLDFTFGQDRFSVVWPVLESYGGNVKAARIQAATMLYHDIKARCVSAKVLGRRTAFFSYLILPDGRTAAQLAAPELTERYPRLLTGES